MNIVSPRATISSRARLIDSEIDGDVSVGDRSVLYKALITGKVEIGVNTTLWGPGITIQSNDSEKISIGNFCSIAKGVTIINYNHNYESLTTYNIFSNVFRESASRDRKRSGPIAIGSDVWLGVNVVILGGVTIGNGAVVGANSVVTKDVEPYQIVGGVPAKSLGFRFDENTIEALQKERWWNWPIDRIISRRTLFEKKP